MNVLNQITPCHDAAIRKGYRCVFGSFLDEICIERLVVFEIKFG